MLDVAIRPDKAKYAPGERAHFAMRVRDADGKPVRAQVGIAVVDDAIFALREATAADPYRTFYGVPGSVPRHARVVEHRRPADTSMALPAR